mgnify:CR=1 FL=1
MMINLSNHLFEYEPYPFGYFNDIFSEDFYRSLCEEYPDISELKITEDKKRHKINKFNKFSLHTEDREFKSLIKRKSNYLKLYNFLNSKEFFFNISEVLLKNNIDLNLKYKIKKFFLNIRKFNLFFEFSSIPCDGGYILPHTDAPKKIMTFIVPIIKEEDREMEKFKNVGTSILSMSDPRHSFNYYNKTVKFEDSVEKKYINFSPNKMLMFIKTHNSLHSVGPIEPSNNQIKFRNSITFAFRKNFD